jgi:hypothetical protein
MSQFRYNLALSVFFDDEQSGGEAEGFPASIMESTEGKERMETYSCLRCEIRRMMIRTSDLPQEVEDNFRRRLKYLHYKRSTRSTGKPAFALVTIGRQARRRRKMHVR